MNGYILLTAAVILLCVLSDKFSDKVGVPVLIPFMFVGILFGSDGIVKIYFANYSAAESICSIALIFIMFYGGFNTKWSAARTVAVKSILLSTAGVALTALITAALCRLLLGFAWAESFLIGAVLGSTDAASVFSILRQKQLNLRDGTASILELESGSNDPVAFLLTLLGISWMGTGDPVSVPGLVFCQVVFGLAIGALAAASVGWLMTHTRLVTEGMDAMFLIAAALLCYGASSAIGGNAYLSVYLMGILIGNHSIRNKRNLVPFFDGITGLAQILIFFLLGLLTFPRSMLHIVPLALTIAALLTFVARPAAVFALLLPFGCSPQQCLLIAWAGLRGASSSVFAIMAVAAGVHMHHNLFHIVFMVSVFSVSFQGTLLPFVAQRLGMIDESADVRRTFNDYEDNSNFSLMRVDVYEGHEWANRRIRDIHMPPGCLAIQLRRSGHRIIPRGDTRIERGDTVVWIAQGYLPEPDEKLEEQLITRSHPWCNRRIMKLALPEDMLIALILRGEQTIIPDGYTQILRGDRVITFR